jgi:hypothetical protein
MNTLSCDQFSNTNGLNKICLANGIFRSMSSGMHAAT